MESKGITHFSLRLYPLSPDSITAFRAGAECEQQGLQQPEGPGRDVVGWEAEQARGHLNKVKRLTIVIWGQVCISLFQRLCPIICKMGKHNNMGLIGFYQY